MSYHGLGALPSLPPGCSPSSPSACCGSSGFAPGYPKNNGKIVGCNNDLFVSFYGASPDVQSLREVEGLFSGPATDAKNVFSDSALKTMFAMKTTSDVSPPKGMSDGAEAPPARTKAASPTDVSPPKGMSDGAFYGLVALGTLAVVGAAVWYTRRRT